MRQIALPLDWKAGAAWPDLIVTSANEGVIAALDGWRDWPGVGALLIGRPRSGKSLMARYFESLGGTALDDADRIDEQTLFHAWNEAQAGGTGLLLVADTPPGEWNITLPDLRSRLGAMQLLDLGPPDDEMLGALIAQHLGRLGTGTSAEVLAYTVRRIERSHAAAERFAEEANALSLEEGKPIGLQLAKRIMTAQGEMDL